MQDNRSEPFIISARKLDLMHNSLRVLALGDMAIVVDGQCHAQEFKHLIYFQAGLIPYIPFHPATPQELRFLDCILPHNIDDLQLTKASCLLMISCIEPLTGFISSEMFKEVASHLIAFGVKCY